MRSSRILAGAMAVVLLLLIGLMSGPAGFGPEPQSAEAALLDEVKKLLASDAQGGDQLGISVGVSGDTAVVGAHWEDAGGGDAGAAYVFQRGHGGADNWGEVKKLTASDAQTGDWFGISVAVSGDTIVVGAWREDAGGTDVGAAYVFGRDQGGTDNWGQVKKLTASDAQAGDNFGISVAVDGDTAVVGAWLEDAGGTDAGAAYVFGRDQGGTDNWGQVKKLTASDAEAGDNFGWSVAVDGDTIVVGAFLEDAGGTDAGAAYVFGRDEGGAGNWGQVKKLTASDAQAGDEFGRSVAVSGDTAVVGAIFQDAGGSDAGAVYLFGRDEGGAGNWGEVKKLTASDAQANDQFGVSVAVSGDTAVVGAHHEDAGGSNAGAAYVFGRDEGGADNWGEVKKLTASDAQAGDEFGVSVAVSGDTTVVGAKLEGAGGFWAGAAYVFGPTVSAGHDLLETDSSAAFLDFGTPSVPAIPADFFGPGSDPFQDTVSLQGVPIVTFGGFGDLGPTDTIVERLQDAGPIFPDTIDIEIVALSLESTAPITITENGGQDPELWDVQVEVPEGDLNQSQGTMTIRHEYPDGGTFDSTLPVKPRLVFTRQSDLRTQELDWTVAEWPPILYQANAVPWCHTANPLTSPAGHEVVEVAGLTTNFFPSITCQPDPDVRVKEFYTSQDGSDARHDLRSAEGLLQPVAAAGHDLLETDSSASFMDFGTPSVPAIPADFFGPGSDPFQGTVALQGVPIDTFGAFTGLSPTDTIVERLQDAGPIYPDTIDIEIVELSLESVAPIPVTYNGGQDPELWDVQVEVPANGPQDTGTMTIRHEYPDGGTFDSTLPVKPRLVFTRQSDLLTTELDWTDAGWSPIQYQANDVPWCHTANPLTSPAGYIVIERLGLTTNFFPSITCQPDPDVRVKQFYTSQDGSGAQHTLRSAETTDVCPNDPNDDVDGDGICVGNGFNPPKTGDNDNCPTTPNPGQENADGDQWGDACETADCIAVATLWVTPPGDTDCDGWTSADEGAIGTDPNDPCANTPAANDEADDRWPPDFDDNKTVNIVDVLQLKPVFGTPSARHDLDASGGNINIVDVLKIKPVFNGSCT